MQSSHWHRSIWGIVVVAIGVVFLLNYLGISTISIGELFGTYWPVFLIIVGLQGGVLQRGGGSFWNIIVMMIGVIFLGRNLGWFSWGLGDIFRLVWPVLIIVIGIRMIVCNGGSKKKRHRDRSEEQNWSPITPPIPPTPPGPPPAPSQYDDFDRNDIFSGSRGSNPIDLSKDEAAGSHTPPPPPPPYTDRQNAKRKQREEHHHWRHTYAHDWSDPNRRQHNRFIGDIHLGQDYWELHPMNLSHFIGDTTLDLTKAQIPIGETRIYVSSFIGDVKVYVPNDMTLGVQVSSSCLIGDVKVFDEKRGGFFNQISVESPSYMDAERRVVLIVSSFIGDVRVTKVG
ncbi:MAG: cell wall-active antibiotics response protein LiaF [Candidatus Cohnella colombiensis]|uniref:Cell wall-active antibiotics response protein LiaF n=1 Tax=Candidatus Cohnella colombiensis TaxID=3121368 RepID=A0AA95F050_9BACL|nr:MAG: cell wall-active antibiotics response protein LiaF [Cohnella sp.]